MSRVGVSHDETRLMIWPSAAAITQVRYKINGYGGGGVVVVVNDREKIAFLVAESGRRSSSCTHTHTLHSVCIISYKYNTFIYYVNIIIYRRPAAQEMPLVRCGRVWHVPPPTSGFQRWWRWRFARTSKQ